MFGIRQQSHNQHLAKGVVTELKEGTVPSMTSQKADLENGAHFIRVLIKLSFSSLLGSLTLGYTS